MVLAGAREAGDEEPLRPAHDSRLHRVHAASPYTGIARLLCPIFLLWTN